jgi:CpeT protein
LQANQKQMKPFFLLLLIVLGCEPQSIAQKLQASDVKKIALTMAGDYSNETQSNKDTSFSHIQLHIKPIWESDDDGYWLYAEQAISHKPEKPFSQCVYHIYLQDGQHIVAEIYDIQKAEKYTEAWKYENKLMLLSKDQLSVKRFCAMHLSAGSKGRYIGSTAGKDCTKAQKENHYFTTDIVIAKKAIVFREREWDENNLQISGPKKGGIIFKKIKSVK